MATIPYPVVVIGAGAAGLSATSALLGKGIPVRLLEAQGQVGGRVKLVDLGIGAPVDSGALFIHSKKLALYAQAEKLGLLQKKYPARYFIDERCLPNWRFVLTYALPNLWAMNRFIGQFYRTGDRDVTLQELMEKTGFGKHFAELLKATLGSSLAAGLHRVGVVSLRESFLEAGMRAEQELGQYPVRGSMFELLSSLFSDALKHCEMNTVVRRIDYRDDPRVETREGEAISASKIIITVPLSVLQSGAIEFSPGLPAEKLKAIHGLGMGQGARLFFRLKKAMWPTGIKQLVNAHFSLHFTIHADDPALVSAFFVEVSGRQMDDDQLIALCRDQLLRVFGPAALEGLQLLHIANWSLNPFIGGLYSFNPPAASNWRKQLSRPWMGRLFFAGEATIDGHFATVDGAILSGHRAADEVLQSIQVTGQHANH